MSRKSSSFDLLKVKLEKDFESENSLVIQDLLPTSTFDERNLIKNEPAVSCEVSEINGHEDESEEDKSSEIKSNSCDQIKSTLRIIDRSEELESDIKSSDDHSKAKTYFKVKTETLTVENEDSPEEITKLTPSQNLKRFSVQLTDIGHLITPKKFFQTIDIKNNPPQKPKETHSFTCSSCPASFAKKISLDRHRILHAPPKFTCESCGAAFKKRKAFANHTCLVCEPCGKRFESRAKFANHIRNIHTDASELELFTCDICGRAYKYLASITRHVASHLTTADLACSHCDKRVKSELALRDHIRTCHAGALITCAICGKRMKPQCIYQHMRFVHTSERAFACTLCSATFKTREKLTRHANTHDKRFECGECKRKFANAYELEEHAMRHADPNAFACGVCGKAFATRTSLNTHGKLHGGMERNLKCPHCDFVTHRQQSMKYHLTTHEKRRERMKKGGEKWLKCDKCDATLKNRTTLWGHYRKVHRNERFACDFCGVETKTKHSMKVHLFKKHV